MRRRAFGYGIEHGKQIRGHLRRAVLDDIPAH